MELLFSSVGTFMGWLTLHPHIAYIVLFLGSYFETLVGPSFFVPGELFLLSGSILAGAKVLNIGLVALALYSGGILGDSSSYWIGRKTGISIFKEGRWIFNPSNHKKGAEFFKQHGNKAIFLARLLGPISWITPFLSGIYEIPYTTFLTYNLPGIFVGIGQFLVVGYFFGSNYKTVLPFVQRYIFLFILVVIVIFVVKWLHAKRKRN